MFLDEMREYLRIGIRDECVPLFFQHFFQLFEIFDDAVVDEPYLTGAIGMRMRIFRRRLAVRRPSQVRDAAFPAEFFRHFLP